MEIEGEIRTVHRCPDIVARALAPDNLHGMETVIGDGEVITKIRGEKLRSVIASVDDYLMNLGIAEELCKFDSR